MYQQYFQDSEWLSLPLVALVFFFLFFVGVLVRVVFGMRDERRVNELASLPFESDRPDSQQQEQRDV
ncbi:MAG: hypothetical protein NTY35_06845 [Planctomycetota bacterium]|nr:hypothetical protein [Planctomycetota bacterium]